MDATPFTGEIYVHTCTTNEKSYVGQTTVGVSQRWAKHLTASRLPHHPGYNSLIAKALRKYGPDAFEHQILSKASSAAVLDNLEKVWIILLQTKQPNGYNIQSGGSLWTPERLAQMSERKRIFSPEGRAALVQNGKNRKGCKQSPEAIAKTAAANRGRKRSAEACANIAASQIGNKKSAETRAKIAQAHRGKKDSPETRAKKSASKSTPEARAANSVRVKALWVAKKEQVL